MIPSALALQCELFATVLRAGPRPIRFQSGPFTDSSVAASIAPVGCLKSLDRLADPDENDLDDLCSMCSRLK